MSTNHHTPHTFGAPLTAAEINTPLGQLDQSIGDALAALDATALAITTTDATAAAGQKVVPVTATTSFIVGQPVFIGDPGGTFESKVIATIQAGVSLTMSVNLTNTYAAGKIVSSSPAEVVDARGAAATLDARLDAMDAIDASLLGRELDYAQITANVSPTATTSATANTVVTGAAVAYNGSTVIMIDFYAPVVRPDGAVAGRTLFLVLYDGATELGRLGSVNLQVVGVSTDCPVFVSRRLTPSAATHTYSIRAYVSAGTGLVAAGAGSAGVYMPAYMRITKNV